MPIPFLVLAAIAASTALGAGNAISATDKKSEAESVDVAAAKIVKEAMDKLEKRRAKAQAALEELGKTKLVVLAGSLKNFVDEFEKLKDVDFRSSVGIDQLSRMEFSDEILAEMRLASNESAKIVTGGLAALGTGALVAYGTFGVVKTSGLALASTGTAISALKGAAATKATLAWLGGGALSVGGGGIALGTAVLGGLVVGPALAIGGIVLSSKAQKRLNEAYANYDQARVAVKEMEVAGEAVTGITKHCKLTSRFLNEIDSYLSKGVEGLRKICLKRGTAWDTFSHEEKQLVYITTQLAQLVKGVVDTPLLDDEGALSELAIKVLEDGQQKLASSALGLIE